MTAASARNSRHASVTCRPRGVTAVNAGADGDVEERSSIRSASVLARPQSAVFDDKCGASKVPGDETSSCMTRVLGVSSEEGGAGMI